MRPLALLFVAVLPFMAPSGAVLAAPQPRIQKVSVRPTRLPGAGGIVRVRARVSIARGTVNLVRAQGSVAGGSAGPVVALTARGGVYEGDVTVPRNSRQVAGQGTIMLFISTSHGQFERVFARIHLLAGDDSLPPDPPKT